MKKSSLAILTGMILTMTFSSHALASTGIYVDGKAYAVSGDQTTFEADGKTFILDWDSVRVQEAGKPDRVLPMEHSAGNSGAVVQDVTTASENTEVSGGVSVIEGSKVTADAVATGIKSEGASVQQSAQFGQYAKFGLSYDTTKDILYYQGQRVRVFEDSYSLGDNAYSSVEHYDELGAVDVEAQRDRAAYIKNADGSYDPGGLLTGLRALSAGEFATRDLTSWTQPPTLYNVTSASSEAPMTTGEKLAFYAPYAEFGLTYDAKTDSLNYQNQMVHTFLDIRQSNGEALESGRFHGTMTSFTNDSGTINVTAIRDYASPDAKGNGMLIGLSVDKAK
jgi:hypothetical protein